MDHQEKKKVTVLTCGRPMGNCEILGREACVGAEEAGATTEILRLHDFTLKPCTGCESCTMSLSKGGKARCVIHDDDAEFLLQKTLYEDCSLIITAPVFFLTVPGFLKILQDRMIPYVLNRPELFLGQKTRVGAGISVGGAEPAWTPMGISMINMFLLYTRVIVEQQLVNFASRPGVVTLNEKALKRARALGRNVALAANKPIDRVRFMGEEIENSCPVCHVNIVQIGSPLPKGAVPEAGYFDLELLDGVMRSSPSDASHVVCPTCDVWGKLTIENGKIRILWSDESVKRHRLEGTEYGKHYELIKRIHFEAYKHDEDIQKKRMNYRSSVPSVEGLKRDG